jgi:hypothetical protein
MTATVIRIIRFDAATTLHGRNTPEATIATEQITSRRSKCDPPARQTASSERRPGIEACNVTAQRHNHWHRSP